jgi:hypothetical protein
MRRTCMFRVAEHVRFQARSSFPLIKKESEERKSDDLWRVAFTAFEWYQNAQPQLTIAHDLILGIIMMPPTPLRSCN